MDKNSFVDKTVQFKFGPKFYSKHKDCLKCTIIEDVENDKAVKEDNDLDGQIISFDKLDIIYVQDDSLYFLNKNDTTIIDKKNINITLKCYNEFSNATQDGDTKLTILQINDLCFYKKDNKCNIPFEITKSYVYSLEQNYRYDTIFDKLLMDTMNDKSEDYLTLIKSYNAIFEYENNTEKFKTENVESIKKIEELNVKIEIDSKKLDNDPSQHFLNDKCSICCDEFYKNIDNIVSLSCGHHFCSGCIKKYDKGKCPLCKAKFNNDSIQPNKILIELLKKDPLYTTGKYKLEIVSLNESIVENNEKINCIEIVNKVKKQNLPKLMIKLAKEKYDMTPIELFAKQFNECLAK
jgi:hypothetical protein